MPSIYKISTEQDFPFNNDFDFTNILTSINQYKESKNKTVEWYDRIMRDIATSHCFRDIRIILVKELETEKNIPNE